MLDMEAKIMRLADVKSATGLSRTAIYEQMAAGKFTRPYRITDRAVGWKSEEVGAWRDALQPTASELVAAAGFKARSTKA